MAKSLRSFMIRRSWGKSDAKRDEGLTTPDNIKRFDNIPYGNDPKFNLLDIYRPKSVEGNLPVIVNIHGGGWVYGTKEIYQYYCMSLSQKGFCVVNFNYRLAPENKFPAQLIDINSAFRFIEANENKYGFDLNNVFIVGDSAGGQMAGMYGCLLSNSAYKEEFTSFLVENGIQAPFTLPERIKIRAMGLNCGVYHFDENNLESHLKEYLRIGRNKDFNLKQVRLVSVINHVTKDFPPSFIMSCEGDFLKGEVPFLTSVLDKNNVEYKKKILGDKDNPLWHVFHVNMKLDIAHEINNEEIEFFKSKIEN